MGLIAASCEKIALQMRLMQQTETGEAAEFFARGQKGSSAMPHKRNPIISERICGLSRVIKKNVSVAMDNVALWYERDISHSSAERIIFPESTMLLDYILDLLKNLVRDMEVFPDNMERNLRMSNDVFFSQKLLGQLIRSGLMRKDAYELIQKAAFRAKKEQIDFCDSVISSTDITRYVSEEEIRSIFDIDSLLKNLETIFKSLEDDMPA